LKRVLFVCTGNKARSQMAEGLLRHFAGDPFEVHSAGTQPSGLVEETVAVMREIGIDVSGQRSKHVDGYAGQSFDYVITVCDSARQACPIFPGDGRRLHWDVEDPADTEHGGASRVDAFRKARDVLRGHVEEFALREACNGCGRARRSRCQQKVQDDCGGEHQGQRLDDKDVTRVGGRYVTPTPLGEIDSIMTAPPVATDLQPDDGEDGIRAFFIACRHGGRREPLAQAVRCSRCARPPAWRNE
jgi:arsenate reductase